MASEEAGPLALGIPSRAEKPGARALRRRRGRARALPRWHFDHAAAPMTYCRKRLAIALKLLSRIGAKLELDIVELRLVTVCFWTARGRHGKFDDDGGLCNS